MTTDLGLSHGCDFMKSTVDNNIVTACIHSQLASNTPVIKDIAFGSCLYIKLPSDLLQNFSVYEVSEIDGQSETETRFRCKCQKPWLEIDSDYLNITPGYHRYQIGLVNKITNDTATLYFAYIIQSNNPDKPYIYMNRGE